MCRGMLPEGHIIQQATSLAELATITDKGKISSQWVDKNCIHAWKSLEASYFHDQESGWLHMKMIILEDRTQGGTLNQKINVGDEIVEESFDIAPSLNFEGNSYLESQVHNGQVYFIQICPDSKFPRQRPRL